jgi:hypothetical protein
MTGLFEKLHCNTYIKALYLCSFLALICLISAFYLEFALGKSTEIVSIIILVLVHVGITLLIFSAVVIIFEVGFRTEANNEIKTLFKENQEKILGYVKSIQHFKDTGIQAVFPQRNAANEDIFYHFESLKTKIQDKKPVTIDILGITLKDFTMGKYQTVFEDLITAAKNAKNGSQIIQIRVLFLYPYSNSAIIRSIREQINFEKNDDYLKKRERKENYVKNYEKDSELYRDANKSIKTMITLLKNFMDNNTGITVNACNTVSFEVKLCTLNPMMHIIRIDDEMFIEPYHLGVIHVDSGMDMQRRAGKMAIPQIMLIKLENSNLFKVFCDHFNFLWADESSIPLPDLFEISLYDDCQDLDSISPKELNEHILEKIVYNVKIFEYFSGNENKKENLTNKKVPKNAQSQLT